MCVFDLGWATLEHFALEDEAQPVLMSRIQRRSWSLRGRYQLIHKATLREEKGLRSKALGDIGEGDEVLVLEMSYNDQGEEGMPRLRMKVASASGLIGWITAITTTDVALLESTNLLAPEMVDIRKRHRAIHSHILTSAIAGHTKSYESRAGRCWNSQWLPNGHYRVLQATDLTEEPRAHGNLVAQLEPGAIVEVVTLCVSKEGKKPMASVAVLPERAVRGWLFLQSRGFDVIDTRDLNEYEKVQAYLSSKSVETQASIAPEAEGEPGEDGCGEEEAPLPPAEQGRILEPDDVKLELDLDGCGQAEKISCAPKRRGHHPEPRSKTILASLIGQQPCMVGCFKT